MEITKLCADSLRAFTQNNYGIQLKSSHAHEIVAAYFGYSSRAALLADTICPISNLKQAEIVFLSPTALITERRAHLEGFPVELPGDLAEGVYLPLYDQKLILHNVWAHINVLAGFLANERVKNRQLFHDQRIQSEGIRVERHNEGVRILVLRQYVSPSLLFADLPGRKDIGDVFYLKRVAGHIGYAKADHFVTEAVSFNEAIAIIDTDNLKPHWWKN